MKMKKFLAIILSAIMLAGLTACSTDTGSDEDSISEASGYDESDINEDKSVLNGLFGDKEADVTAAESAEVEEKLVNSDLENGQYRYDEYENHIEIREYLLDAPAVEIPAEIDGKPVTVIGLFAFCEKSLNTIIIPDSVTTIGSYAFDGCASLTSVTIPESITVIGICAFNGCTSLTSIDIPDDLTGIGQRAFVDTPWLESQAQPVIINGTLIDYSSASGNVIIPDSVTSVGGGAFEGCTDLISIIIPDGVTSIGTVAFCDCTNLTSITIPDSVTSIGSSVFNGCTSLTSITIPDSVTEIGSSAFGNCPNLTDITIPERFNDRYDEIFG